MDHPSVRVLCIPKVNIGSNNNSILTNNLITECQRSYSPTKHLNQAKFF